MNIEKTPPPTTSTTDGDYYVPPHWTYYDKNENMYGCYSKREEWHVDEFGVETAPWITGRIFVNKTLFYYFL